MKPMRPRPHEPASYQPPSNLNTDTQEYLTMKHPTMEPTRDAWLALLGFALAVDAPNPDVTIPLAYASVGDADQEDVAVAAVATIRWLADRVARHEGGNGADVLKGLADHVRTTPGP